MKIKNMVFLILFAAIFTHSAIACYALATSGSKTNQTKKVVVPTKPASKASTASSTSVKAKGTPSGSITPSGTTITPGPVVENTTGDGPDRQQELAAEALKTVVKK